MSVVVPQPSVPRYCAMVVVKPPEFEKIATDPFSSTSSGLSPPSAPPMRTRFQESATPRQLAPNMSMPLACPSARISRASCTEIFSVIITIFSRPGLTRINSATPSRTPEGGVPRASLVVIAATLASFNIPEAGLLLIIGIDQFLDMGRSATNVIGNTLATAAIAKWEGERVDLGELEAALTPKAA